MTRLTPQPTCAPHSITSSACCWRCKGTSRQRLRGPEIDDQLELGRLLDRQFGRFCALQDFIDKNRSPLEISSVVCRVGDQPPSLCCVTIARHDREVVLGRELHDYARLRTEQRLNHYCLRARRAHCRKRAVEFTRTIYQNRLQL